MASTPLTLVPFHSLIDRQVAEGLSADTDRPAQPSAKTIHRASSQSRPRVACIATAPLTLVLFNYVHVAEGLSEDTDHPAEPSAKTFHGPSSGSPQVLLCFASVPGEPRSLSFYAYVQVHKGQGADTDHLSQLYPRQFVGPTPGRAQGQLSLQLHLGHSFCFILCKSTRGFAATPTTQLNPRPRQFTGSAKVRTGSALLCLCTGGTWFNLIICLCTSPQGAGRRHRQPAQQ